MSSDVDESMSEENEQWHRVDRMIPGSCLGDTRLDCVSDHSPSLPLLSSPSLLSLDDAIDPISFVVVSFVVSFRGRTPRVEWGSCTPHPPPHGVVRR
mgnify:CR=1 FL=1